ncbi:GGDEF domain-containing protein [Sphaerotilus sp.]|uniref:GGDEF domain-containing protein n=1 Tax=Sphaerotilus sp. TaxID=2093942 RepID=UPI002ACD6831|nr:GGDEF domain-containing protein [Sphaerotilus sp.]MDZ7856435.1 GGDEF domain-containing protein [Sphaerotilus sp.]
MPQHTDPAAAYPEIGPLLHGVARWVRRVGVRKATAAVVGLSVVASVALTLVWHLVAGWSLQSQGMVMAALVPVPIASVCAAFTLKLILALDQAMVRLEELAMTDSLTNVRNRRCFMQAAALEFERATRHNRPMAIVLIDVDHFKRINDRHGHQVGDKALIDIARACQATLRKTDLLARFGGEEFIVLLPETGQREAVRLAERMRSAVATDVQLPDRAQVGLVTISLGAVALSRATPTLDLLIQAADQALYDAKRAGRDRVHTMPVPLTV